MTPPADLPAAEPPFPGGVAAWLAALAHDAAAAGWTVSHLPGPSAPPVPAFERPGPRAAPWVHLSAGIHGDEPAGPLAVAALLRGGRLDPALGWAVVPALNPWGLAHGRREDAAGLDLNRDYRVPAAASTRGHLAWLRRQPAFALSLCLHEDWEASGFYHYEIGPAGCPAPAAAIHEAVTPWLPLETAPVIDGRPAAGPGLIRPDPDPTLRDRWPETILLVARGTPLACNFEAPSAFPLDRRVAGLAAAVEAAARFLRTTGG